MSMAFLNFGVMSEKKNKFIEWFRKFTWKQRLIMYAVAVLVAVVYIYVFSDSNYRQHKKLDIKIKEQKAEVEKQEKNVEAQSEYKDIRTDSMELERYRREVLNMKKENEDLYIVKK